MSGGGAAPVRVAGGACLDLLVLTCRSRSCTEQWTPVPVSAGGGDGVVQLSMERCPACGSSAWEVTQVQVSGSPSRTTRGRGHAHRASRSGSGWAR
jgi:hypothetical protein